MSEDKIENLMLLQFRCLHDRLDSIEYRMGEQNARLHALEDHVSGLVVTSLTLTRAVERLQADMSIVKRRLDLVDA